jgi:hypothetical protein
MSQGVPQTLTAVQLVDEYFIENRNRVLELAAYLDRLDRAGGAGGDFRVRALHEAVLALTAVSGERVAHIQMLLSDPTSEPRPALDRKGAVGAYDGSPRD